MKESSLKIVFIMLAVLVIVVLGGLAVGYGIEIGRQRGSSASDAADSEQAALLETISALLVEQQATPETIVITVVSESSGGDVPDTEATVQAELTRLAYVEQEDNEQSEGQYPIAIVQQDATIVRKGPGIDYRMICYLDKGDEIYLVGMNKDASWYKFLLTEGTQCYYLDAKNKHQVYDLTVEPEAWISASYLNLGESEGEVVIVTIPPTEAPFNATATPQPTNAASKPTNTPVPPTQTPVIPEPTAFPTYYP